MQIQVKAWGNSQGIRISKEILQEANIAVDDVLDVKVVNGMITLVKRKRPILMRSDTKLPQPFASWSNSL